MQSGLNSSRLIQRRHGLCSMLEYNVASPGARSRNNPSSNHNFYELCSCSFLLLQLSSTSSSSAGTLWDSVQSNTVTLPPPLSSPPLYQHTALPAALHPCQSGSFALCTHMHIVYDYVLLNDSSDTEHSNRGYPPPWCVTLYTNQLLRLF